MLTKKDIDQIDREYYRGTLAIAILITALILAGACELIYRIIIVSGWKPGP